MTDVDPGDDRRSEVTITVPDRLPRSALLRAFAVLPHVLVLAPIGIAMDLGYPILMIVAAVRRGWPPGLERFLVQVEAWVAAVIAYVLLVTDEAPRFGLAAYRDGTREPAIVASPA